MNTREQYLAKRVEVLEASLRLAYEEMFVAERIIEHVESVANAFAFDLYSDIDPYSERGAYQTVEYAIWSWSEAQEKARADSDKARGIQRNPDGTIAFIDPEKFSERKP